MSPFKTFVLPSVSDANAEGNLNGSICLHRGMRVARPCDDRYCEVFTLVLEKFSLAAEVGAVPYFANCAKDDGSGWNLKKNGRICQCDFNRFEVWQ